MKIVRYQVNDGDPVKWGWLLENDGEEFVGEIHGDIFGEFRRDEATTPLFMVTLHAPVKPGKIVCVGRNYQAHAEELGNEVPEMPLLFFKPPSSLIGPEQPIILPPQSQQVDHEGELALVIGKQVKQVAPEDALDAVYGYTVANDVTARDLQRADKTWVRGKGFDTFCPAGPWVETEFDPNDVLVRCHVNDELRQMASTRDMMFGVPQIIAYISSIMTLEPGDLILTGTPAGVGEMKAGDLVTVSVEGLGDLQNPVIEG